MAHKLSPKIANGFLKRIYAFIHYKKLQKSPNLVTAQFSKYKNNKLYSYQRDKFLNEQKRHDFFTKKQKNKDYNITLAKSSFVLSPFGYVEICFRDFEAIMTKNILIKPDMSHITTFPNIYKEDSTYISVDWELNDCIEIVKDTSENFSVKAFIKNYAYLNYILEKKKLENLLESTINLLTQPS